MSLCVHVYNSLSFDCDSAGLGDDIVCAYIQFRVFTSIVSPHIFVEHF
jgi:hypothetical protein